MNWLFETKVKNLKTGKIEKEVGIGWNPFFKKGNVFSKGVSIFKNQYEWVSQKPIKKK